MKSGSYKFKNKIKVTECACSGGKFEKEGNYGDYIDIYCNIDDLKTGTFEKAEAEMVRMTINTLLSKAKKTENDVDILIGGDLMNQCTSTGYGLSSFDIPYMGLYGACSTFAEGMLAAAMMIDSGHIGSAIVVASSHFCSAERQFRFPLEYGSVPGTTAQTTVTGSGAVMLSRAGEGEHGVMVTGGTFGYVSDRGIKDAGNMGAAMSSAAADTIIRYFGSGENDISSFDRVATGDLGTEGLSMLKEMLSDNGIDHEGILCDCGVMIYDLEKQDVGCGGSGCGCSALMTSGYFYDELKNGRMKKLALVGTGALMSPQTLLQGESIPAVAHLVCLEKIEN